MLVRMNVQISGTRDGEDWPAPGGTVDVTDDEATVLTGNGLATVVDPQPAPPMKAGK